MPNNCGCNPTVNPCGQSTCQETSCACKVYISSDCVDNVKSEFACLNIESNLPLTQTLEAMDVAICDKLLEIDSHFQLVNVGEGEEIYKGVNLLGQKEIRTLKSEDSSVTIITDGDEIDLSAKTYIADTESVTIDGDGTESSPYTIVVNIPENTQIEAGDNIEITGVGTTVDPFIINAIIPDVTLPCITSPKSTVTIGEDEEGCITIDTTTPCITSDAETIQIDIDTETNCVNLEMQNLQKTINSGSFPYTLTSADDKYTIFLNNGASDVVINVPNGLVANFSCVFIQEGSGEITVQETGTATLLYPITLQNIIKGQNYWAMIEKKTTTDNYFLLGSLKVV